MILTEDNYFIFITIWGIIVLLFLIMYVPYQIIKNRKQISKFLFSFPRNFLCWLIDIATIKTLLTSLFFAIFSALITLVMQSKFIHLLAQVFKNPSHTAVLIIGILFAENVITRIVKHNFVERKFLGAIKITSITAIIFIYTIDSIYTNQTLSLNAVVKINFVISLFMAFGLLITNSQLQKKTIAK